MSIPKRALLAALCAVFFWTGFCHGRDDLGVELAGKEHLVDIQALDPTIDVKLMYATADNFLGKNVYGDLKTCYLRREAADKLLAAQKFLKERSPEYRLLIYDGLRPRNVQYMMWDIVKGTADQPYVADPEKGSIHNYGAAVDLTIADERGMPLDMGTPFDYFGLKAHPQYESYFLHPELLEKAALAPAMKNELEAEIASAGPLTAKALENRLLLREVMTKAGFAPLETEWWHFNAFSADEVKKRFTIIE